MRPAPVLALFATTLRLAAQAPTLSSKDSIVRLAVENVPALLAQLPKTAVGQLLEEPEVKSAFALACKRQSQLASRREQLWQQANVLEVELEPWLQMNRASASPTDPLREVEVSELLHFELSASTPAEGAGNSATMLTMSCTPRAEGRWTARFEQRAKRYTDSKFWRADPDARFEGFATYAFVPAALSEEDPNYAYVRDTRIWMMHLPGTFAQGSGKPEQCATIASATRSEVASASVTVDLQAYLKLFLVLGAGIPAEFAALGLDGVKELQWRMRFVGDRVFDELSLRLQGKPRALIGALLTGSAPLPAQPLPDGALLQLRTAIDVKLLVEALKASNGELPGNLEKDLFGGLTGGVALGVAAPARGQVVPRIFLSLGIADDAALDRALVQISTDAKTRTVTYDEVPCTVLTLPNLPIAIQPTYCKLDGVLHVAESGASMRAFLKARKNGGEAMAVGEAPVPAGEGELLPFDLRCDEVTLYRTFYEVWLPLYAMAADAMGQRPLLQRDDMPSPDIVAKHLGTSRGVLRHQDDRYLVQHLGALGGPEAAALAMTWGPIVSANSNSDYSEEQVAAAVGRHQLARIWTAIEQWKSKHGAMPESLGELVAAGTLPSDALLVVPDDPEAESIALPGNDGKTVRSSFRYFPQGVDLDNGAGQPKALLIAITPGYNRAILADDGTTPDFWNPKMNQPIDKFGK